MAAEELKLGDRLAIDRTVMATERTLMAWVRTALSLISFGFTIYKVLQQLIMQDAKVDVTTRLLNANGPRRLGLLLLFLGTSTLIMGTVQYWSGMRQLGQSPKQIRRSPAFILAVMIALLGAFLFVTIIANAELL